MGFAPPVLGWGTWNSFGNAYSSSTIQQQAQAMLRTGLRKAGYQYVLLDEGWWLGQRDARGNIMVDQQQWPALAPGETAGDMSNIVRYLHGLGLKAGIYTDVGEYGCSYTGPDTGPPRANTGSLHHYQQDFLQFAKWGFDYVKVDWCGGDKTNLDPATQYGEVARAIADAELATGHSMVLSICDWSRQSPWDWGPGIGGLQQVLWRTGWDITGPIVDDGLAKHLSRSVGIKVLLRCFDQGQHPEAQHTGYFNDLDMLVVGMRGTTAKLDRTHLALWAISGAPLIVGADLTKLTAEQVSALTQPGLLAIDQDVLGLQGFRVTTPSDAPELYVKPLHAEGQRAVMLLNRTDAAAAVHLDAQTLGLKPGTLVRVTETFSGQSLPLSASGALVKAEANSATLLLAQGEDPVWQQFRAAVPVAPTKRKGASRSRQSVAYVSMNGLPGRGAVQPLMLVYRNASAMSQMLHLQVNEETPTVVQLAPTRPGETGRVMFEAALRAAQPNSITVWLANGSRPDILAVEESQP